MPKRCLGILITLFVFSLWPISSVGAIASIGSDLFYLAPDSVGLLQVWRVGSDSTPVQISQESSAVVAFDVAYNNNVVFITSKSLTINALLVTTGGPLDSPALGLADVSVSPDGLQAAVVAVAEAGADPSEGVWLYDSLTGTWTLALTSSKSDPAAMMAFTGVTWSASGDRLVLQAAFSADTAGVTLFDLNTGRNLAFNQQDTGIIDAKGYSRGNLTLDGTDLIISDVPGLPNGNGYWVDVHDYTRIVPLFGDDLAARYLSHALPIANGVAFFVRDFGNNITTSEVWQLLEDGTRTALGSIPNADLGPDTDWTENGGGLAYINAVDDTTGLGTVNIYRLVDTAMEAVPLTTPVTQAKDVQWGPLELPADRIVKLTFTAPNIEFLNEENVAHYSTRLQWNAVAGGNGTYQVKILPSINGVETFDVQGVAAKLNLLACKNTFTISVTPYDAGGVLGAESFASTFSTPPCEAALYPVTANPLYPPAFTGAAVPVADTTTATTPETAPPAAVPAISLELGVEQDGPATVLDLTAGQAIPENTLLNDKAVYAVELTWSAPQQAVSFFLVNVSPPFGENNSQFTPASNQNNDATVIKRITGLVCGETYTFVVSSLATDGQTILSNSAPVTAAMPACQ